MRTAGLVVVAVGLMLRATNAEESPRSLDTRLEISLFAEQPQIATPTGLHVDARGRVWAIECNTHFRPKDYKGHPSDRVLVFADDDGDGRAENSTMFADGFTATMSVCVRPPWMPPIQLGSESAAKGHTQVFVATRNQVLLLEDTDGDDVSDRKTVLFRLDTKGDYPHNGFAGFAIDPLGTMFVGMGENLGEPYKVVDRFDKVVFESGEGGNIYRFRPDGTEFSLYAHGFWNPHASCFDAFGRMFMVDNDPDSRPPCRLMHVIEGGNYGYRFSNGRKGLHPFTSWNGQVEGTLPMVAGTGEAPSGVIALEHQSIPEEYRGDLLATSWGDHRIDRFKLQPQGCSFTAIPEPFIVGGESFRPVGIAMAPDGSLYCTDWVKRDYELHGHGRIWRIGPKGSKPTPPTAAAPLATVTDTAELLKSVQSPDQLVRRIAARKLSLTSPGQLVNAARNTDLPVRARYEALVALVLNRDPDNVRVLKAYVPAQKAPFDPVQTLMQVHFDERPSVNRILELLTDLKGSDPMYVLAGIDSFSPVLRAVGHNQARQIIEVADRCVASADAFGRSRIVHLLAKALTTEELTALIESDAVLSNDLRVCAILALREASPRQISAIKAALDRPEPPVRRAAAQWAAEERRKDLRHAVESSLARAPMTTDLFLATIAALEMLDGKSPEEFDKTPSAKYVVPILKRPDLPPSVVAAALRIADANDPGLTVESLTKAAASNDDSVRREAVRTLCASTAPEAMQALMSLADRDEFREDVLSGLSGWLLRNPSDQKLRSFFLIGQKPSVDVFQALRGLAAQDSEIRKSFLEVCKTQSETEFAAQAALALKEDDLPEEVRSRLEPRPKDPAAWKTLISDLDATASADRGRAVFFHPQGPGCSRCHTIDGRGGKVGPDLTRIGQSLTREKLIDSILEPSREVAPQFTSWQFVMTDGRLFTGMIVHENEGKTIVGDADGKTTELATIDIEERRPQKPSVMPERLTDRMTIREFRDLLAFLQAAGD